MIELQTNLVERALEEQRERILKAIREGKIFDPEILKELAEIGIELEDYEPEPEPKEEPKLRPCPYYQPPFRKSASPLVIGKAIPMKNFDYQAALQKKGWAR